MSSNNTSTSSMIYKTLDIGCHMALTCGVLSQAANAIEVDTSAHKRGGDYEEISRKSSGNKINPVRKSPITSLRRPR